MKDLSIIIVTWNTKDLLKNCIDSISVSRPNTNFEIIVVDNGSTDGSLELLDVFKKRKIVSHVIRNGKNLGFSKANNKGIKIARGEYILLLNSDTKVKKGAIDALVGFAKSNPDVGVVGSQLLNEDGSIQASCFKFPTLTNAIRQYWFGEMDLYGNYYPKTNDPALVDVLIGASFLITPKAIKKVGLLDERYFFYFEDLDYCRKVKESGLKVYYLPESQVIHYHGGTVRKITTKGDAWKKLVPGSKIYHGVINHYLITFVMWTGQKWQKLFKNT